MMQDKPNCCNDNCNQGRDCPVRAGTHKPVQALHQIQEPAAAEQAAWHAGLDEGRAQAAPAAVAVPELQDMLRELRVQISAITVQLPQSVDCSGVWMAHDKMSAALAATPAANSVELHQIKTSAPVVLPEPDAWRYADARGHYRYRGESAGFDKKYPSLKPQPLYTEQQVRALLATGGQAYPCWSCNAAVTKKQRSDADGNCPHCNAELDLEDWPRAMATGGQGQAVANPAIDFPHEEFDAIAATRYKVVAADQSMFWEWAVVAGDGTQQLYVGRKVDCENMARKFAGAFADGSFHAMHAAPQQADARDALDQSGWVSVDDALPEHAISEVLILQMYFEADGTARMHDKEDPALGYLYNIAKGHCHQDGSVPRWSGRSGDDFGLLFRGGWRVAAWRHIHPASNYVGHIAAISATKGK